MWLFQIPLRFRNWPTVWLNVPPDVVKELMKQGIMATVTQSIDAETAELVTLEFGHKVQRVSESDVEEGLVGADG